uniref:Putative major core protein n=1 Tax=Atrato Reo-like virus TaxID=2689356 RepID=A0A6B9KGA1_9REOV|nr:putative major core protein [Atrato Reo-like virus]QHA33830.1 putative major core protein [Atrato Reo-like virus]
MITSLENSRSQTTATLSSVKTFTVEPKKTMIIVYTSATEPVGNTSCLLQFVQKDIGDIQPMVNFRVINTLDLSRPGSEPTAVILMEPDRSFMDLIYDDFFAFADPTFDPIRLWIITAHLLRRHGNILYSKPKTEIFHEPYVVDRVDLKQFKSRDLLGLAEKIANKRERMDFLNIIKFAYKETNNEGVPVHEKLYSNEAYWGSEDNNYATYLLPLLEAEVTLIKCGFEHFSSLYVHPIDYLTYFDALETDKSCISHQSKARAYGANRNVRVPKPLTYTVDVSEYYASTAAIRELKQLIDEAIIVYLQMRHIATEMISLQRMLRISSSVTSGFDVVGPCVNPGKFCFLVDAIFRCNINPNLYLVDIDDIDSNMWRNPFTFVALRLFVSMIPAPCIPRRQRLKMNNITMANILYHRLEYPKFQRLAERLKRESGISLPDVKNPTAWANSEIDWMGELYVRGDHLLNTATYGGVRSMIALYFNDLTPEEVAEVVRYPSGNTEPMSLCAPYFHGGNPIRYARDSSFDDFRKSRHMNANGVLLMNSLLDYTQPADNTIWNRTVSFATAFYEPSKTASTGMTTAQFNAMMEIIETSGLERIGMIVRSFFCEKANYSTLVAADGVVRDIPNSKKTILSVSSRYMVTGYLMVDADYVLNPDIEIRGYGKYTIAYTMQTFKTLYHEIRRRCNVVDTGPLRLINQSQLLKVTTTLMQVFFEAPDFDPKDAFGYEDSAQWTRFLALDSTPVDKIPALKAFLELLEKVQPVLRSQYLNEQIMPYFYLTKGTYSRGGGLVVLASNAIPEDRYDVVHTITGPRDYQLMLGRYVRNGPEHGNEFEHVWFDKVLAVDKFTQYAHANKVPAIKVHMNVRVQLNLIYEDGTYPLEGNTVGNNLDAFKAFMDQATTDILNAKMLHIVHTLIINDIGSHDRPPPFYFNKQAYSLMMRMGDMCMSVPSDFLSLNTVSPAALADMLCNRVTFRKDMHELWESFHVEISKVYGR